MALEMEWNSIKSWEDVWREALGLNQVRSESEWENIWEESEGRRGGEKRVTWIEIYKREMGECIRLDR